MSGMAQATERAWPASAAGPLAEITPTKADAIRDALRARLDHQRLVTEGGCIGNELRQEALAYARNRTTAATDRMVALGIPRDLCGELALGVARIEHHDRYWEPAETGPGAITLPVWVANDAIDILAIDAGDTAKWLRRTDIATTTDPLEIDRAIHFAEPLHVHATPLDWLRAGGRGVAVLDWNSASFMLSGVRRFICHDRDTAKRLDRALRHPTPRFTIRLAEERPNAD